MNKKSKDVYNFPIKPGTYMRLPKKITLNY